MIVHGDAATIARLASTYHVGIARHLASAAVLEANSAEIDALAADRSVDHLSGDVPVSSAMSVTNTSTGADQVRSGSTGLLGIAAIPGVNGSGIGIAVIDSGIAPHAALAGKVVANVDLAAGTSSANDDFGHGTHIGGIIAGSASAAAGVTPLFNGGIAPGARLINVRVLGADGSGLTSDVLAGIDWAIANRAAYNIRVVNLSVGHSVMEPAAFDPLCEAVAEAYQAGIVVVAAAGNAGKLADGTPVLGGITSPGNSPFAITVGAINTWQTTVRSDDTMATYSSRGPTRFDLAVKPDLAAPGNKIVSLEAYNSSLSLKYPALHVAGSGTNAYMRLSGTSMATGVVSGAAALLLSGNPSLTPAQVKAALQNGSSYMANAGLMAAGAGSANFWASRKITTNGLVTNLVTTIAGLTISASNASFWDAGTLSTNLYGGIGIRLLSPLLAPLYWLNPSAQWGILNLVGLTNPLASLTPNYLQWGVVSTWTGNSQIIWGDTIYNPQGQQIIWGDVNTSEGYQIIWGDAVVGDDR